MQSRIGRTVVSKRRTRVPANRGRKGPDWFCRTDGHDTTRHGTGGRMESSSIDAWAEERTTWWCEQGGSGRMQRWRRSDMWRRRRLARGNGAERPTNVPPPLHFGPSPPSTNQEDPRQLVGLRCGGIGNVVRVASDDLRHGFPFQLELSVDTASPHPTSVAVPLAVAVTVARFGSWNIFFCLGWAFCEPF